MNRIIRFIPSSDFLQLFIAENERFGGVKGVHLCTFKNSGDAVYGTQDRYRAITARIAECLPKISSGSQWRMTMWLYHNSAVFNRSSIEKFDRDCPTASYFADKLAEIANGFAIVAFKIDFDASDPSRQWLFVVV